MRSEMLFHPLTRFSRRFHLLVTVLLIVIFWGVYAYSVQFTQGLGVTGMRSIVSWGFYVTNFVFFIGISHVGALMSAILRLTNAEWRKPITRMAEVVTFASLLIAMLMPLIDLGRPDRILNLLLFARIQSPLIWDFICIGTYFIGSSIFLYLPLVPDIAACRDRLKNSSSLRRRIYGTLSLGWLGVKAQYERLERAIKIMTVLIIPIAISVHTIVSWDFAMTLRTGWNSTIFGPYFVAGALLSGVATVVLVMAFLTRFYHLEGYIKLSHFANMGKLLLALIIILVYLTINEFLVPSYKFLQTRTLEGEWLASLFWGQYSALFWFQIMGGLVIPAFILALPRTRTLAGYFAASLLINVGMWVERLNIIVPSLALPQLPYSWGVYAPTWVEISITAAAFAGFALIYVVFTRLFPIISIWETEEGKSSEPSPAEIAPFFGVQTYNPDNGETTVPSFNSSRRGFLRLVASSGTAAVLGLTVPKMFIGIAQTSSKQSNEQSSKLPLSNLGVSVSLEEAQRLSGLRIMIPLELPEGSALMDVRITEAGKRVSLLFSNPHLTELSMYSGSVALVIFMFPEKVVQTPPAFTPSGFKRIAVRRYEGVGKGFHTKASRGGFEPGKAQWWQNGVSYSIFANLSLNEMVRIAESLSEGVEHAH